jgi:hypothetical protein
MITIISKTLKIFFFVILIAAKLNGQSKQSSFYFNLNTAQEYHSNLFRVPDSLRKDDFRLNSFLRVGYYRANIQSKYQFNFYYENRLQRYFTYQTYNRMENIFSGTSSFVLWAKNKLHFNNRLRNRNYSKSKSLNYFRNVFTAYAYLNVLKSWQISTGYRYWLKRYPNTGSYKDYISNRIFLTLYFNLDKKTRFGVKNELNWHRGNLYPFDNPKIKEASLEGTRFATIISGNRIFAQKYFLDIQYRFELDSPQGFEIDIFGEQIGDEDTDEILADDSDFDYSKHQLSSSILYKTNPKLSFFGFAVIQYKKFQHWRVKENGPLRRNIFSFVSFTAKYNFNKYLYLNAYFNIEKNSSNHPSYRYSREITGLSLRYKF